MMNGSSEDSAVFTNNDPLNSKRVASAKEDQVRMFSFHSVLDLIEMYKLGNITHTC